MAMNTSAGFYVAGGLLAFIGVVMMIWGAALGFLDGTSSFWLGLFFLVAGIALLAVGAARHQRTTRVGH